MVDRVEWASGPEGHVAVCWEGAGSLRRVRKGRIRTKPVNDGAGEGRLERRIPCGELRCGRGGWLLMENSGGG